LNNLHFDGTVTIKSASTSSEAVVSGISLNGSSGLAFANLDVSVPNGGTGVYAANTSNLAFSGLSVHGVGVGGTGNGFFIRDSSGVTINGSDITNVVSGIGHYNSDDLTISNNNLHGLQTDGIYGGGSSHVVVSGNHITDFTPNPGDHPDAIQFWAGPNGAPGTDITVSDNVISRGSGAVMQGVFVENTQNITITGNAMVGTMGNGISLSTTTNGLVENNYVQGYSDMNSWITTRGTSANVTVVHNTSQAVVNYQDGGAPNPNYFDGDNTVIGAAPVGDQTAANAWLAQHVSLSPTGSSAGDVLAGGAGDDTLNGLAGADTMSGGFGDDTYVVDNAADVIVENLNAGVDTVRTSLATYTLSSNVEKLVLTGSSAQSGMGNSLNNTLTSNAVGATLNGGAGNDVLVSAGGADTLTGGTGADTFYFQKAPATVAQITDFTSGQDKLDLHTLLQAYHGTDPLADHWVKFQSDASGTTVMVDLDGPTGSAGFVAVAKLAGVTSLTSTDWVFH
jgi:parallel beta-helix repeat protein